MRCALMVVAVISLALTAEPACAQTVYGPGGLFVHPTAFTPARGTSGINLSALSQKAGSSSDWYPLSYTTSPSDTLQLGALYVLRRAGDTHGSSGGLFGKARIWTSANGDSAFALAGSFIGGDVQQSSLSTVFSRRFGAEGRPSAVGHAGLQWVRRADLPRSDDGSTAFVGLEIPLTDSLRVVGEYGAKLAFNRKATSAYGIMWSSPRGVSLGIGMVNIGRSADNRLFFGAGYPLGSR